MNACATALATGVPMAIHSDANGNAARTTVTGVVRCEQVTASGRTSAPRAHLSVADALRTITRRRGVHPEARRRIRSIECGKRADIAVLETIPETSRRQTQGFSIWGTMQGGGCSRPLTYECNALNGDRGLSGAARRRWSIACAMPTVRIAVLVNEFGELPIDADLIDTDGNVVAIAGGGTVAATAAISWPR